MKRIEQSIGIAAGVLALLGFGLSAAQAEPPIKSPEDAACRAEAKARIFSTPNPRSLPIEEVGKGIYFACMDRIAPKAKSTHKRGRHHAR